MFFARKFIAILLALVSLLAICQGDEGDAKDPTRDLLCAICLSTEADANYKKISIISNGLNAENGVSVDELTSALPELGLHTVVKDSIPESPPFLVNIKQAANEGREHFIMIIDKDMGKFLCFDPLVSSSNASKISSVEMERFFGGVSIVCKKHSGSRLDYFLWRNRAMLICVFVVLAVCTLVIRYFVLNMNPKCANNEPN